MEIILITTGLVCIISAIIGGGLEAFNIKVPSIISSIKRQILLAVFGIGILAFGIFKESEKKIDKEVDKPDKPTATEILFYKDADGDGFGNKSVSRSSAMQPENYVRDSSDDDDNNPYLYSSRTAAKYYADVDSDGFGDRNKSKAANKMPEGYVRNNSDCDDSDRRINAQQTAWFEVPGHSGSFDFNCDAVVSRENEKIYSQTIVRDHTVSPVRETVQHKEGWKDIVPDCGQRAAYIAIENGRPVTRIRTQRCK